MTAADHTVEELMVTALARRLHNRTRIFNGAVSFIPVVAMLLARATHAPELMWAAGSIGVDPHPTSIPDSTIDAALWREATMLQSSPHDVWGYAAGGKLNTFCFRGVQIDPHGNVNNTVIGPYDAPKVRLPGSGGMSDLGSLLEEILLWSTTHDRRTFVEQLDYRTAIGWGDGGEDRARLGLPGGPSVCVTNLAVLDFHPVSHRMRLQSVHPGVTVDDVLAATDFELVVEGDVGITEPPTSAQLALIKQLDPTGMRARG